MRFRTPSFAAAAFLLTLILAASSDWRGASSRPAVQSAVEQADWGRLPLRFEPNVGQTDSPVHFVSRGPGYTLFVTGTETVLSLSTNRDRTERAAVRMRLTGARPAPRVSYGGELPGHSNYLLGGDPSRWRTGVRAYDRMTLEQVYEGIDLAFHGTQRQLEYDFIVAPGADPTRIALEFKGADRMRIDEDGHLVMRVGQEDVVQHKPVVYQDGQDGRATVDGEYILGDGGQVRFAIGEYDASLPLVIDPVVSLGYSSFLGGTGNEIQWNGAIAVDRNGNAYVAGETSSIDFPLAGAMQTNQPALDIFVTKIAADGSRMVYSTYIGGAGQDEAHDVGVTANGELWVAGFTSSVDSVSTPANEGFPIVNAFQPAFGGGIGDAIVLKLSADGSSLVFSSYLGGTQPGVINNTYERAHAMTLDAAGNAYLTGFTGSETGFATIGAFQTKRPGGGDAWVAKISAAGAKQHLTYLGSSSEREEGYGVAVDRDGFIYVTGATASFDNPLTAANESFPLRNPFQAAHGSPGNHNTDAFVTKLLPDLSGLVYSSYLGGNRVDNQALLFNGRAGGIVVDGDGAAWVTGHTQSTNFPTVNPLRPHGGGSDIFIAKVAPDGRSLLFSTYYGGPGHDFAQDIAIDGRGSIYIAAHASQGFPLVNALPGTPSSAGAINIGFGLDAAIVKLTAAAVVEFATFLGGNRNEYAMSIAADDAGAAYVMGATTSFNFPLQAPFQATCMGCALTGGNDAFVAKVFLPNTPPDSAPDAYGTIEDTALNVAAPGVLGNDSDADGNPLTAALVSGPSSGSLSLNDDGSFIYTPAANFHGTDAFSYRADDGRATSDVVSVTLAIASVNDAPSAEAASLTLEQESPTAIMLMGSDADGDALTFTITDPPDHGTLTGGPRDVIYTGNGGYAGPDQFTFKVSDGVLDASANVTLTVTGASVAAGYTMRTHARGVSALGANTGGEALAADFSSGNLYVKSRGFPCGCPLQFTEVLPDGTLRVIATNAQMQNSPGPGIALDPLIPGGLIVTNENFRQSPRIARVDIASGMESTVLASPWTINPAGNGAGAQQFATDPANPHLLYFWDTTRSKLYRLNRSTGALDELLALNQTTADGQPIQDGFHETSGNDIVFDPVTGTLLVSDYPSRSILELDPRTSPPNVQVLFSGLPAAAGPLALDVQARRLYAYMGGIYAAPRSGGTFSLVASNLGLFDITVGRASSGAGRSLYAMDFFRNKIFEIRSLNSPPVANDDSALTDEDVAVDVMPLANDSDDNAAALSVTIVDAPANGTVEAHADGSVRYTPAPNWFGIDVFSYRVNDGEFDSELATVTVTVNSVNDAPTADAGGPYTVAEGASVALAGTGSDLESAALSFAWDLDGDGQFEISGATPTFSAASIGGPTSRTITLRVTDSDGASATASATVTIENVAPLVQGDAYVTDEDTPLTVAPAGVLANDSDFDALTATLVSSPANGSLTLTADGSFSYTPSPNFSGSDTFTYRASDGDADSAPVSVVITINPLNDPPDARDDAITVAQVGGPWPVAVLANDTTLPETGETMTVIAVTQPANGTATISADGKTVVYDNARRFAGTDQFTYTLSDGNGGTDIATVVLIVERGRGKSARADLELSMSDTPDPAKVTGTLTYVLTVRNNGPAAASEVTVTDALPAGLVFSSATTTQGACSAGSPVLCSIGDLASGAVVTVSIATTVTDAARLRGSHIENQATVAGAENDPHVNNNTAKEGTKIRALAAALNVGVTDAPDPVTVGGSLTYTVTVHNSSFDLARGVTLRHTIYGQVLYASITPSQGTCGAPTALTFLGRAATTTECHFGTVAGRDGIRVTFVVLPQRVGTLQSTSVVNSPDLAAGSRFRPVKTKTLVLR